MHGPEGADPLICQACGAVWLSPFARDLIATSGECLACRKPLDISRDRADEPRRPASDPRTADAAQQVVGRDVDGLGLTALGVAGRDPFPPRDTKHSRRTVPRFGTVLTSAARPAPGSVRPASTWPAASAGAKAPITIVPKRRPASCAPGWSG